MNYVQCFLIHIDKYIHRDKDTYTKIHINTYILMYTHIFIHIGTRITS